MKTRSLFIIGGALLAFASCTQEGTTTGGFTQEQVDSIVNVRVAEQMTALQASNDSTINALAQWKADSIVAAMKGGTTASRPATNVTKTAPKGNNNGTTKPVTPPAPVKDEKSRNNQNTTVEDQKARNNQPKTVEEQKKRNNQK